MISTCKIGITRCFFVLNMSGYITNCRIEFYSIFLFCRVENGDLFQQRRLQNRIICFGFHFFQPPRNRRNYISDIACECRITRTRLFKYIENFYIQKLEIFR